MMREKRRAKITHHIYFNSTSTGCPGRKSAASAGENFASIMNTRFARVSRLKITGGVYSACVEM